MPRDIVDFNFVFDHRSVCSIPHGKIIMIKLIRYLVKKISMKLNRISNYYNYLIFQPKILLFSSKFM